MKISGPTFNLSIPFLFVESAFVTAPVPEAYTSWFLSFSDLFLLDPPQFPIWIYQKKKIFYKIFIFIFLLFIWLVKVLIIK